MNGVSALPSDPTKYPSVGSVTEATSRGNIRRTTSVVSSTEAANTRLATLGACPASPVALVREVAGGALVASDRASAPRGLEKKSAPREVREARWTITRHGLRLGGRQGADLDGDGRESAAHGSGGGRPFPCAAEVSYCEDWATPRCKRIKRLSELALPPEVAALSDGVNLALLRFPESLAWNVPVESCRSGAAS